MTSVGDRAAPVLRRDAVRNYGRILDAAREVFGEAGASASIEQIAARAGVGVGTVYRRFASKDALIDELLRLVLEDLVTAAEEALARPDGHGLHDLLRSFGRSFAEHARYATLLLEREHDPSAVTTIMAATRELTARAAAAGTIAPGVTAADITALVSAMRGLAQAGGSAAEGTSPGDWQRFLDIHLAGLRAASPAGPAENE